MRCSQSRDAAAERKCGPSPHPRIPANAQRSVYGPCSLILLSSGFHGLVILIKSQEFFFSLNDTRVKIMANPSCGLLRTPPKIDIQLKQNQSAAEYYTTGDFVEGIVSITVPNDLPLGIVQIYLQGILSHLSTTVFILTQP